MNRVIKFRAYHKVNKTMEYEGWNKYKNGNETYCSKTTLFMYGEDAEIMQFTGLTDKNGVEIYEGDVVEKCYGSSVKTGVVAWHQERAMFILQDGFNEPLYQLPLNMIEAIGNVFENPELLNY
jgi:uncharacterized phage protein (TIGR01671 family)